MRAWAAWFSGGRALMKGGIPAFGPLKKCPRGLPPKKRYAMAPPIMQFSPSDMIINAFHHEEFIKNSPLRFD
jgi:hypothetical protein